MIYDEESDRHVHITFEQAMYATGYGKAGGPIGDIFGIKNISAEALGKIVNPANGGADAASRAIFTTFAADDACKDAKDNPTQDAARLKFVEEVIALVKAGVWVPIEIVIARPFIEHLMLSAIVAVAGRETGATLFGCAVRPRMRRSALHPTPLLSVQLRAQAGRHANLGEYLREDHRGVRLPFRTHSHAHTFYAFQYRGTGSLPHTHSAPGACHCSQLSAQPFPGTTPATRSRSSQNPRTST